MGRLLQIGRQQGDRGGWCLFQILESVCIFHDIQSQNFSTKSLNSFPLLFLLFEANGCPQILICCYKGQGWGVQEWCWWVSCPVSTFFPLKNLSMMSINLSVSMSWYIARASAVKIFFTGGKVLFIGVGVIFIKCIVSVYAGDFWLVSVGHPPIFTLFQVGCVLYKWWSLFSVLLCALSWEGRGFSPFLPSCSCGGSGCLSCWVLLFF